MLTSETIMSSGGATDASKMRKMIFDTEQMEVSMNIERLGGGGGGGERGGTDSDSDTFTADHGEALPVGRWVNAFCSSYLSQ